MDINELFNQLKDLNFEMSVPVDVEKIAELLGITITDDKQEEFLNFTAYIKLDEDDKPVIWLNPYENESEKKRRFVIAHLLGHLCLHMKDVKNAKDKIFLETEETLNVKAYTDIQELQANNFAINLLIPSQTIKTEGEKIIENFQKKYNRKPDVTEFTAMMAGRFMVLKYLMKRKLELYVF